VQINTKFDIFDQVKITDLNLVGQIIAIKINHICTSYMVRYFFNGDVKEYWLFENALVLKSRKVNDV